MATKAGKSAAMTAVEGGPLISDAKLKQLYATMLKCRMLAAHIAELRKPNQQPHARSFLAALEAAVVGTAIDLHREDWIAPPPGDSLTGFIRGVPLTALLSPPVSGPDVPLGMPSLSPAESEFAAANIFPYAASLPARVHLATGLAVAKNANKKRGVAIVFGEGQPNLKAQLSETLAFAAGHRLPLLLVIHRRSPARASTGRRKIGDDAAAVSDWRGVPVIPVDGHDLLAIYRVACESIHKARHRGGPTIIEAIIGDPAPRAKQATIRSVPNSIGKMEERLAAKGLFSTHWKRRLVDDFERAWNVALKKTSSSAST